MASKAAEKASDLITRHPIVSAVAATVIPGGWLVLIGYEVIKHL